MNKYRVEVKLGNIGSFNDSIKFNKYTKIKVIERKGIYYARDKTNA